MHRKPSSADRRPEFSWSVRVYYEDTDAGGIVYYANYLRFFERARTEWLRALGASHTVITESSDQVFVVRSLEISYLRPARLDDMLDIELFVTECRRASMQLAQRARRDGEILAEGHVRIAMIRRGDGRAVAMPARLIESIQKRITP